MGDLGEALDWFSLGCWSHLGNEAADARSLFLPTPLRSRMLSNSLLRQRGSWTTSARVPSAQPSAIHTAQQQTPTGWWQMTGLYSGRLGTLHLLCTSDHIQPCVRIILGQQYELVLVYYLYDDIKSNRSNLYIAKGLWSPWKLQIEKNYAWISIVASKLFLFWNTLLRITITYRIYLRDKYICVCISHCYFLQ